MSMGLFLCSFTTEELEKMEADNDLIDQWVLEEEKFHAKKDIDTAWDVLEHILSDVRPWSGDFYTALYNGCFILSAFDIKYRANKLAEWTDEKVLDELSKIHEDSDLYHLDFYQENDDMLLDNFHTLVEFYQQSAEKGLGVLAYHI